MSERYAVMTKAVMDDGEIKWFTQAVFDEVEDAQRDARQRAERKGRENVRIKPFEQAKYKFGIAC